MNCPKCQKPLAIGRVPGTRSGPAVYYCDSCKKTFPATFKQKAQDTPVKPANRPAQPRKQAAAPPVPPARFRLTKSLHGQYDNPPPVGCIAEVHIHIHTLPHEDHGRYMLELDWDTFCKHFTREDQ